MNSRKAKLHPLNELPHIYEIEDMLEFCSQHEHTYIYGAGENQEYLLKYFDICGTPIAGYIVSDCMKDIQYFKYREISIIEISDFFSS
jgi:hypothetical protein